MKIPLIYPKIPDGSGCPLKQCVVFEKYDGTNMHWFFDKLQLVSFGTRRSQYEDNEIGWKEFRDEHPELVGAISSFHSAYQLELTDFFSTREKYNTSKVIVFTEWFGKNSFAGQHDGCDSTKRHILIDVGVDGKILNPSEFLSDFSRMRSAKVIYKGKYTGQFAEDVRNGKYSVNEGVVCKGVVDGQVYMTKIKTNDYMKRLKEEFKDNWKNYWE